MEYKCNICNKKYKSYKSLWNHNKKFHTDTTMTASCQVNTLVMESKHNVTDCVKDVLICKYCKKKFTARQNRWSHEKICKNKN